MKLHSWYPVFIDIRLITIFKTFFVPLVIVEMIAPTDCVISKYQLNIFLAYRFFYYAKAALKIQHREAVKQIKHGFL